MTGNATDKINSGKESHWVKVNMAAHRFAVDYCTA